MARRRRIAAATLACALLAAALAAAEPALTRQPDGVVLPVGGNLLKLQVCGERVLRVLYAPAGAFFARDSLMTHGTPCRGAPWDLEMDEDEAVVTTAALAARISLSDGAVRFLDRAGRLLLAERSGGGKTLQVAEVQGERTFHLRSEFEPAAGEAFYGLGQHQNGLLDYRGHDVDLYQHNIVAAVPFLVSSRGYGVLGTTPPTPASATCDAPRRSPGSVSTMPPAGPAG